MFAGTRHFFQSAHRFSWMLCLLLGGIHGGVVPAQDSPDSRAAIPSADRQKSIRTQLDETLGLSKATTTTKKQQALRDLMKLADDPATTSDELYGVLQAALPLIREKSDLAALRTCIQKLTETFQVDSILERSKQLDEFIAACKSTSTLDPAVKDVVALVELANGENRFGDAKRSLEFAEAAAKKLNAKPSIALLGSTRGAVTEREQSFAAQKKAQQTLVATPADPQANFLIGLWLAIFEAEWEQALPYLAKGSDAKWQAAAKAELAVTKELDSRLALADAWWEVAQTAKGTLKTEVQRRNYESYAELEPDVTSPLVKRRVKDRKTDLAKILNIKPAPPDPNESKSLEEPSSADATAALEKAVNWLSRHQNPDGSWGCKSFTQKCKDPSCALHLAAEAAEYQMAATAFGLLPYFATGHTAEKAGPYKVSINKALTWITTNQDPKTGRLGSGNMYEHGLGTIALCKAYGIRKDRRLQSHAQAAIAFIEDAQNDTSGGWHYTANPRTAGDTSVIGWQLMALKSGDMAGLRVNPQTLVNAKGYLKTVAKGKSGGQFSYMAQSGPTPTMSAVGLLCNQYGGMKRTDPAMVEGQAYVMGDLLVAEGNPYFLYYATQVMHNLPGPEWDTWNRQAWRYLIKTQIREGCATGSWSSKDKPHVMGPVMMTSISALSLQIHAASYKPQEKEAKTP